MAEIRVFHSHIEITPYKKGDCENLERMLSKWDAPTFSRIPIGYHIEDETLYIPRGISTALLEGWFHSTPIPIFKYDDYTKIKSGVAKFPPKTTMQENGIKFLTGTDEYSYTGRYSQLGLNLDTGDGKTYTTVTAILKMKIKAIIITHQTKLKDQWIKTFDEMTSFPMENLCDISGSDVIDKIMSGKINAEIYCVNHQTIHSYGRAHGWNAVREFFKKIKVGIKVVDEAHKFFESTLMLDYFSNCYKSFYLTATFGRSDQAEISIYKKAFASLARYGEETLNYDEKRKHINFVIVYFRSHPMYNMTPSVRTGYGFSSYKYIDYELKDEPNHTLEKVLFKILDETRNLEGKTLIISPKKETVVKLAEDVSEHTGEVVGTVFSNNSDEVNKENLEKRIISSTVKSVGEGVDIKKLRILINLEPIGSKALADQVRGRLREYSPNEDTFLFYPVDLSVQETSNFLKRILPVMKKKCKEIIVKEMYL